MPARRPTRLRIEQILLPRRVELPHVMPQSHLPPERFGAERRGELRRQPGRLREMVDQQAPLPGRIPRMSEHPQPPSVANCDTK